MERIHPSFIIAGERKCGTSSLYRYLVSHPNVLPCKTKEPQFFSKPSQYISQHFQAYLDLFPYEGHNTTISFQWPELDKSGKLHEETISIYQNPEVEYLTGEASANLLSEGDPGLVNKYLPGVKIIICLREPTERAFSHFRMFERFAREGRKMEIQLGSFKECMQEEIQKFRAGEKTVFLGPGIYVNQIEPWLKVFGRTRMFFIHSRDLENPNSCLKCLKGLCSFLGIIDHDFKDILNKKFNKAPTQSMSKEEKEMLQQFYRPYNERLYQLLGMNYGW